MATDRDWMLVEFEGTYKVADPSIKGRKILRPFHVKVKMKKQFLEARGLRGAFATYYKEFLKRHFPGMIDLHEFRMIEATEVDGSKIHNPKAMSHQDLVAYIKEKRLPVNILLYDDQELRHQVVLYETDPKGQQKLQGQAERVHGGKLNLSREISEQEDILQVLAPSGAVQEQAAAVASAAVEKQYAKSSKQKAALHDKKEQALDTLFGSEDETESAG